MLGVRELKHRYKMLMAKGRALPKSDLGIALPLSTGSPFLDSMLNERVANTAAMNEEEHLMRAWQLMRDASEAELELAIKNLDGCLNDHKLLLAVWLFGKGEDGFKLVLKGLPMKWRLLFPVAVIKPSAAFFTGWRTDMVFRLVDNIDYPKLKAEFRETLARARDEHILKFREILKTAMALLHWRPEGEKEEAIHEWCFEDGRPSDEVPLLSNYLRAREKVAKADLKGFRKELDSHEDKIPLTSLMGLLSTFGEHLRLDSGAPYRDYAVECASPIEAVLRFREWGEWMTRGHIDIISKKVQSARGLDIPFIKTVNAYLAAPKKLREPLFDKVYLPMMKKFSDKMAEFIPKGSEVVLMQPANFVNLMSFLFLATVSYERSTRVFLVGSKLEQLDNSTVLNFDALRDVMLKDEKDVRDFLFKTFGGHAITYGWKFDDRVAAKAFDSIRPEDMLIMDMPFVFSTRVLERLLPMKRVLNLANNFGSPSEVTLNVTYVPLLEVATRRSKVTFLEKYSSSAVSSLAGFIERLEWFNRVGGDVRC